MERAVLLSESMESRGFARDVPGRADRWAAVLALLGSLGLGAALLALVGRADGVALAATAAATVALTAAVVLSSRSTQRTRYRPRPLTLRDVAVMATALAAPVAILVLGAMGAPHLRWPGDVLAVPAVDPLVLVSLALLAVPALVPSRTGVVA